MRGEVGLGLAMIGLALGPGSPLAAGEASGLESTDELMIFLEFLGDEATASDAWKGFFDSLPEEPEDGDTPVVRVPVAVEEPLP